MPERKATEINVEKKYRIEDREGIRFFVSDTIYMTEWPSGGITGFGDIRTLKEAMAEGTLWEIYEEDDDVCETVKAERSDFCRYA